MYKAFAKYYLNYGDNVYDQAFNTSFIEELESFQYNVCLALAGARRGRSKFNIYKELGLESFRFHRWHRDCLF